MSKRDNSANWRLSPPEEQEPLAEKLARRRVQYLGCYGYDSACLAYRQMKQGFWMSTEWGEFVQALFTGADYEFTGWINQERYKQFIKMKSERYG